MAISTGKVTVSDELGNCTAEVDMNETASVEPRVSLAVKSLSDWAKGVFPAEAAITLGTALVAVGEAGENETGHQNHRGRPAGQCSGGSGVAAGKGRQYQGTCRNKRRAEEVGQAMRVAGMKSPAQGEANDEQELEACADGFRLAHEQDMGRLYQSAL